MRNNTITIQIFAYTLYFLIHPVHTFSWCTTRQRNRLPTFLSVASKQVQIFENTFSPDACDTIHSLAVQHNKRTKNGSSIFIRPPHNNKPLSPLERSIDSALTAMGDSTKLVEYWSRSDYLNIETHADIDESMLENDGVVRCPLMGHVLYLKIKKGLFGPTCVFPNETTGWNLEKKEETSLIVVPAVQGRILRFPGNAMHAVPKPHNRWFMEVQEDDDDDEFDDEFDDDEWLDDENDYDDEDEVERSVLLFNTWPDDEPGPEGIHPDNPFGSIPDGIVIEEKHASPSTTSQEIDITATCNRFDEWKIVEIQNKTLEVDNQNFEMMLHVPLMGKRERRRYSDKVARMTGPIKTLSLSLEEATLASLITLHHCNSDTL
mmetsp:Transcript_12924/g.24276  ORF Transcript_12924/g.24276 Transcript_12924/m.24276 type:complete len:376 (+) Transcript_12924:39-1166(+)